MRIIRKNFFRFCRAANKSGNFSLIMRDLERRRVEDTEDGAGVKWGIDGEAKVADGNGGADAPDEAPPRTGGRR